MLINLSPTAGSTTFFNPIKPAPALLGTMKTKLILSLLGAGLLAGTGSAETIFGLTDTQGLVSFDSATPGTVTAIGPVTGALSGHTVRSIDFRPNTTGGATLYAISASADNLTAQVYSVNFSTGALTALGTTFALTGNTSSFISIDFNPAVDRLRIVTGSGQNFRWNPTTNTFVQADTPLTFVVGGGTPFIGNIAYDQNTNGTSVTTLFGYDLNTQNLVRIGGQNGNPSPNGGLSTLIGPSGVAVNSGSFGLDISTFLGAAYANADLNAGGLDNLYQVNLSTGAFTLIGGIGGGIGIRDIAISAIPEPGTYLAGVLALGGVLVQVRRRRQTTA